ncbi:MAG: outer membrane protein assembly factor BamB family protein [Ilumatobacteraceae bacterium]
MTVLLAGLAACGGRSDSTATHPSNVVRDCHRPQQPALGAYDAGTGDLVWMFCSPDDARRQVVGITSEVVYVDATPQTQLVAVDRRTGTERWRFAHDQPQLSWPLGPFAGGGVVVIQVGGAIVGLDALTGAERWRVEATEALIANTEAVAVVAHPTGGTGLRALNRSTGETTWSSEVPYDDESGVVAPRGATAVDGDLIVVPTGQTMTTIDTRTGHVVWEAPRLDHPAAAHGYVLGYVPDNGPQRSFKSTLLRADTGAEVWTRAGMQSYGERWAIGDNRACLIDEVNGSLVTYDLSTGNEVWRSARDVRIGEPQQFVGDNVVVRSRATVTMLSGKDGSTLWSLDAPSDSVGGISQNVDADADLVFVSFDALPPSD